MESALKYYTNKQWRMGDDKSYRLALRRGWHDECTAHMEKTYFLHTFESCMESASKYTNRKDWRLVDDKSYSYATRRGWLDECTAHMKHLRLQKTYV
jgi:hypothetical protein